MILLVDVSLFQPHCQKGQCFCVCVCVCVWGGEGVGVGGGCLLTFPAYSVGSYSRLGA